MAKGLGSGKKWVILNVLEMGRVDLYFFHDLFFENMYFPLSKSCSNTWCKMH